MTWKTLLIAMSAALLASCSDSDSNSVSNAEDNLNNSPALSEQFGSIRERRLDPESSEADRTRLVNGYNQFSLDVHKALVNNSPNENAIVSGYSMAKALTMLMSGTAGTSREALANLLSIDTISADRIDATGNALDLELAQRNNEQLTLRSANRLFVSKDFSFNTEFLDNVVANYGAPVTTADFINQNSRVVEDINAWANHQTNGFIPRIIEQIDAGTAMAILNATLLDAGWREEFDDVGVREFTTLPGTPVSVPYFSNQETYQAFTSNDLTMIDIPYAGSDVSMLIVMPEDLASMEAALTSESINSFTGQLSSQEVLLSVPEWAFEQSIDAKALLEPLGLPSGALDFSVMLAEDPSNIEITQAIQKARIEVDKDGTVAAAVTSVVVGVTSIPPTEPEIMTINKPFWYAIRDRVTGLLLFTGRVTSPSLE